MATTIANIAWENHDKEAFIEKAVLSAGLVSRFSLIEGVKDHKDIPVFDATLIFGNEVCTPADPSTANIDTKEFVNEYYRWDFSDCKDVLWTTYRSEFLRKGVTKDQVHDDAFSNWLFGYFARLAGQKLIQLAGTELIAEMIADTEITGLDSAGANIEARMQALYVGMPDELRQSLFNVNDHDNRPAFVMNSKNLQAYMIYMASLINTTYAGGKDSQFIPRFYGLEVVCLESLPDTSIILTPLSNLVYVADDISDVQAIDWEFKKKENLLNIWGQFRAGFSYYRSELVAYDEDLTP